MLTYIIFAAKKAQTQFYLKETWKNLFHNHRECIGVKDRIKCFSE